MMTNSSIDFEIIWKKIHGSLTEQEEHLFSNWLSASAENRRYFEDVKMHYESGASLHRYNSQSIKEAWLHVDKHLTKTQRPNPKKWIWSTLSACILVGITAAWFILSSENNTPDVVATEVDNVIMPGSSKAILVTSEGTRYELNEKGKIDLTATGSEITTSQGTLTYDKLKEKESSFKQHQLLVPRGGKYSVVLDDGTKVWVNSESSLKYPVVFSENERVVYLSGEAFFDVAEDKTKPFKVITSLQKITVLGTEFNVSAYDDQKYEHTTLSEGKVNVELKNAGSYVLTPGFQSFYDKSVQTVDKREVEPYVFSAWKDDVFVFENEPLGSMLNTLSRWYDVEVFYRNVEASNVKFTGEIERYESFENILRLIEKTNTVKFEIKDRSVIVNK